MTKKTLGVDCDAATAGRLAEAIRGYAHAAYPAGGSECAQAARAALLEAAASCDRHQSGNLALRRRQLPLLRAGVRWYFSTEGPGDVEFAPRLEALLAADNKSTA
jgi:hypothetical protein